MDVHSICKVYCLVFPFHLILLIKKSGLSFRSVMILCFMLSVCLSVNSLFRYLISSLYSTFEF